MSVMDRGYIEFRPGDDYWQDDRMTIALREAERAVHTPLTVPPDVMAFVERLGREHAELVDARKRRQQKEGSGGLRVILTLPGQSDGGGGSVH